MSDMEKKLRRDAVCAKYRDAATGKRMFAMFLVEFEAAWPFDIFINTDDETAPFPVLVTGGNTRELRSTEIVEIIRREVTP